MFKTSLLLFASVFSIAQQYQSQTPEAASALLTTKIRGACEAVMRPTGADLQLPADSHKRFVYSLNGKQFSQQEWIDAVRRSRITECTTDDIRVTFIRPFPSKAVVTYRMQHTDYVGRKSRIFSVYAKHTFEYVDSDWVLRTMEASNAK